MEKMEEKQQIINYNSPIYSYYEKEEPIGLNSMVNRGLIPASHKRIADNYMFIKKMYGSFMVYSCVTNKEKNLLAKFDFAPLEYSTVNQIKDEIEFLKKWSASQDFELAKMSDEILQIRIKELKNIVSNRYVFISNEIYTGFKVLEQYIEKISKYSN